MKAHVVDVSPLQLDLLSREGTQLTAHVSGVLPREGEVVVYLPVFSPGLYSWDSVLMGVVDRVTHQEGGTVLLSHRGPERDELRAVFDAATKADREEVKHGHLLQLHE